MALTIKLSPELERRLEQEAGRRGQNSGEFARSVLEERLASLPEEVREDNPGLLERLLRATPEEVQALLRAAGASPVERLEELQGDFWPTDESVDDFLTARRQWEFEGSPGFAGDESPETTNGKQDE